MENKIKISQYHLPPAVDNLATLTDATKQALSVPSQFILVSGLTGSGKTNILRSIAEHANWQGKNVVLLSEIEEWEHSGLKLFESSRVRYSDPDIELERKRNSLIRYSDFARKIFAELNPLKTVVLIDETSEMNCRLATDLLETGYTVVLTIHATNPYDALSRLEDFTTLSGHSLLKRRVSVALTQRLIKGEHFPHKRTAHISEITNSKLMEGATSK